VYFFFLQLHSSLHKQVVTRCQLTKCKLQYSLKVSKERTPCKNGHDNKSQPPYCAFTYHQHLHPLVEFESSFVDEGINEDYNLDIFEQIANTNELAKEVVNMKLFISK